MTERVVVGAGWLLVAFSLLLAVLLGALARCGGDDGGTYMPAPAEAPGVVEKGSSGHARCERAMDAEATAGKGPAQSLITRI